MASRKLTWPVIILAKVGALESAGQQGVKMLLGCGGMNTYPQNQP
jgi:hypothetical protein